MLNSTYDFYQYSSGQQIETRSILLLGLAQDGPINFPTKVTNYAHAKSIFGEETEGNLLSSLRVIFDNIVGEVIVYAMRVSGQEARKELKKVESTPDSPISQEQTLIGFRSYYGGEKYNNVQLISQLDENGVPYLYFAYNGEASKPYYLNQYNHISELCKDISEDTRRGDGWVLAFSSIPRASTDSITDDLLTAFAYDNLTMLEGGLDETDICKDEYYDALEEAYELLSGFYCDIVIPVGAYFDDHYPMHTYGRSSYFDALYAEKRDYLWIDTDEEGKKRRFHEQLIRFCENQMRFGFLPHGVIGFAPVLDEEKYIEHPYSFAFARVNNSALATRDGLSEKLFDNTIDKGFYISIVMSDFYDNRDRHVPAYLVYACSLVNMSDEATTTNQSFPSSDRYRLVYEFESEEIEKLSEVGVVTFRNSPRKGLVVSNGCTAAISGSKFHWYSNVRQCQVALSKVFESLRDFEGRTAPMQILLKEAESIANAVLNELKSNRIINDFAVSLRPVGTSEIEVELSLVPRYAVESISVSGIVPIFT